MATGDGGLGVNDKPGDASENSQERLLAAVREEVLAVGLDRVSATSVARRAGVARITLYRRGGDVKRLILSALTLETEAVIARASCDLPEICGRARVVELTTRLMQGVNRSPFVSHLMQADTTLLDPYFTSHLGASQRALLAAGEPELIRGMADGSIRQERPEVLATVLLQALTPFVRAASITKLELGDDVVEQEVRRLIDGYLRPTE